jgi:VWFA-related protein
MNRIHRSTLFSALLFGAVVSAQTPQAPRPTFQLSVNYVDVDVTVTDAAGNFVTGLTRDDFQLLEDGKPQKVDAFSFVELPIERPVRFQPLGRPVPVDVRSNRDTSSGRVYVIVLDDLDVSPLRTNQVRKSAHEFIEQHFGPHDIAAVVSTSGRRESAQEFTSDPALLLAAIDNFTGQRLQSAEVERIDAYYQSQLMSGLDEQSTDSQGQQTTVPNLLTRIQSFDPSNLERGQRAVGVLNTLKSLAEFVDGVRGRRKALLLFSEGIDYPMADVFDSPSGSEITKATQDAISAAAHANVNFFTLDPRGLIGMSSDLIEMTRSGPPDYAGTDPTKPTGTPYTGFQALQQEMHLTQDSLRTLADGTGGFAAVDTNSFAGAFDRVVQANSRYYLLGYTPPSHPRDGRFHHIQVTVKRPGLKAVARRGYPSPSGKTADERRRDELDRRARESRNGGSSDTSPELLLALNSPVQQPGLALVVQAVPFRGTAAAPASSGKARPADASVALAVELDGSQLQFAQQPNALFADSLELSFFAISDEGKAQRGTRLALNLAVRPDTYQRMKSLGLRINSRTPLAPGRYQLRVGARDPLTNKAGTVFYDVRVPDFTKDPLMMSGLLLSSPSAPEMLTPQHDPLVEKLLGAPATSRREFTQNETLALLTEIYDNMPPQQLTQIDVSTRLIGEDGREAFVARDSLGNGSAGSQNWTTFSYTAQIPLKNVAPGRYLLNVEAHDRRNANGAKPTVAETVLTITPAR